MNNIFSKIKKVAVTLAALPLLGGMLLASCSDEPDSANYYTFKGQMMSQYLQNDEQFSEFATIVERAGLMDQLSAYGHYTLFLPNNTAVDAYLAQKGISSLDELSDADCDTIARTHIMTEIYSVSDMPTGYLPTQNMLKRNVSIRDTTDADKNPIILVNKKSIISLENQDDSVENGIVQQIDVVMENSTESAASIMSENGNVSIFANALHETGLDQKLDKIDDKAYAEWYKTLTDGEKKMNLTTGSRDAEAVYCPETKLYGFTIFVVPDNVLKDKYQVTDVKGLYNLACKIYDKVYPQDSTSVSHGFDHLTDSINPLYRFMAYHVLDRNVQGYNYLTVRENAGINTEVVDPTEWYTTLLPYSMVKVQKLTVGKWVDRSSGIANDIYLNRRFNDTYSTKGIHVQNDVNDNEYDHNAVNGMYFYIDDILKFDETTKNDVMNDRIRMDFSTIFPEIMTNNMRMNGPNITASNVGKNYYFPDGYLNGVVLNGDSRLTYWYARSGYYSMNGDEMDAQDVFDITFNIPPVPFTDTWQIRLGFAPMSKADGAERGQVQIYIDGKAQGIPLNMAEPIDQTSVYGGTFPDYTTIRDDADARQEDFKILKNKGYYRGPHSVFNSSTGTISGKYNYFSQMSHTVRKVLATLHLEAGMNHTIRIKNVSTVLAKNKEAMLDYLELVPKSVYGVSDSGAAEDDL